MSKINKNKPIVLIVDDEPHNLKVLARLLEKEYDIRVAKTGEKCIEIATGKEKVDLILLDINLPEIDGYEVCKRLKENSKTRSISIIFITGRTNAKDEEKGFLLGANDYIVKPFIPIVVAARVRNQINLKLRTDELEENANTDSLTGLANRRTYEEQLKKLWNHCLREHHLMSIIMVDIDHFKLYNDHYGHGAGDICLRQVAQTFLKIGERALDVVARYGGEEFVIILPNTDSYSAQTLAETIRDLVFNLHIPHAQSQTSPYITVSLGVATSMPTPSSSALELAKKADKALYKAKQGGRNRVAFL